MKCESGSVLVGVLWCLALLSIIVVGALHTSRLDLRVVKNHGDRIQAYYLALAGIEKAKAVLYQDARDRRRAWQNHTSTVYDLPSEFKDVDLGRGKFRVIRQSRGIEGWDLIHGVTHEESRLNANTASVQELSKLYGMTQPVAAAIVDYRDSDQRVTEGGAEFESYAALQPPRLPRDAPFLTTRELLMVYGLPVELFFGEDANQNGVLDPEEDDGSDSFPPDNSDGILNTGWSGLLTVDSGISNDNAAGETRINIQTADETDLATVDGISTDLAAAIVAYRDQERLESIADLLDVVPVQRNSQGGGRSGRNRQGASSGNKLIDKDLLMQIADDLSVDSALRRPGVVNINTAAVAVLMCLPGLDQELAQAIVSHRESSGFFSNIAWLLDVPGMDQDKFKQLAPRVSARSETFRILSEGKVTSSGATQRLETIVRIEPYDVLTLAYREAL